MNVNEVIRVFQRYWALMVTLTAVGLSVSAGMLVWVIHPSYEATSRMFVSTQSLGSADELLQGSTYTQARMTSYAQIASDPIVLEPVIEKLRLDTTPEILANQVEASAERDQLIIEVVVTDGDPAQAANIVNEISSTLSKVITDEIEAPIAGSDSMVSVTILKSAIPPSVPTWPKPWIVLTVGGLLGLLAGVGFAFLLQASDSRVRNIDEVRRLVPFPVLGLVLRERGLQQHDVLSRLTKQGPLAEAFRSARTNLQFIDAQGTPRRVLLVTSSVPAEGKSTAAMALSLSLASAGHRVALIDADLRKPQQANMAGLEDTLGLTNVLLKKISLTDALAPVGPNRRLWLLPAGKIPPNPAELLDSAQFKQLLETIRNAFDYVIIDSPPILAVTDAAVLSQVVDGVLLVAAVETVRRPQLETCVQTLQQLNAPVVGVIVNRLSRSGVDAYSYYGNNAYRVPGELEPQQAQAKESPHRPSEKESE